MSNNTDDTMRRIEEALDEFESYHRDQWQARAHDDGDARRTSEARDKLLATVRAALPRPIPISCAEYIEDWRRRNADDPGNIAVAVELDGSCTVPGMAFVVTEHDGTVTRFVPAPTSAQPSPKSGESPAVSAEVAQKDAGGWGEDDDRFHANEEHERAVEAWLEAVDSCEIRALQTVSGFQVYFLPEHVLDEALRLMRRQPKETTDGK